MKISEVLWIAANDWLADGLSDEGLTYFSCCAVDEAAYVDPFLGTVARKFLRSLGANTRSNSEFSEFQVLEDRQGARYAWLMFASMYAEELGI